MAQNHKEHLKDFLDSRDIKPSTELNNTILNQIKKELSISYTSTFIKLTLIHSVAGALTLTFCPQFSLSLTGNHSLFHILHGNFGIYGCMAVCGSIFLGAGALCIPFLLNTPELKKLQKYNFITFSLISFLSLMIFSLLSGKFDLGTAFPWMLGAILGGILIFKSSVFTRKQLLMVFAG